MTLRTRLTIAFTVFAAVLLTLVVAAVVFVGGVLITRSLADDVNHSVARVRATIAADAGKPESAVQADIARLTFPSGVMVRVNSRALRPFPPPDDARPPERHREHDTQWFGLGALLPHPVVIPSGAEGDIFIAPDLERMRRLLQTVSIAFLIGLAITLVASWAIGRWITAQALAPLISLTRELRRFAAGDFTPRPVLTRDRGEIGELVDAYNGAAQQVSAAFDERARAEAEMRTFLGEASHEMRTPLTVIGGYVDLLQKAGDDANALLARALPTMRTETRRLRTLVERLLLLARFDRLEAGTPEPLDVRATAQEVVDELRAARGGEVALDVRGEPVILGEPNELHEALGNLIDNALKYGAGSPVRVAIAGEPGEPVVVRVSDGGPGIAPGDRERLFARFFRGSAASGTPGAGLGLAIVARAVARLHGEVALESGEPEHTTFRLSFPPYRAAAVDRSAITL